MEESSGPNKKAIIGLVVIVLLVIAATGFVVASGNNKPATSDSVASTSPSVSVSPSTSPSSSPSSDAAMSASSFKDGTYKATGTYDSPGGPQSIDVSVTLSGGTITDTSVTQHPTDDEASDYQSKFVSGYKSQVVGKKISDVNLSRISGSSLTPLGFNSAIDQIKTKAQA